MLHPEYIRSLPEPSEFSLLSVPYDNGFATFTFLHADQASWPSGDEGLRAVTERGHAHPVYHAVLYTSGHNRMIHEGRSHEFRRGSIVLTEPGSVHEYRPQSPGGGSFIEVTFDMRMGGKAVTLPWYEILSHWFGRRFQPRDWPLVIPPPHLERLEGQLTEVLRALSSDSLYGEPEAALLLGQFFLSLCRYFDSETESSENDSTDGLERARRTLEREFSSSVGIRQLSSEACMSEGAFIRAFSTRYGDTPIAYRKKLRITAAKHLLSVSGRSIGEIAENVGYNDIYTFSRTFRSVTGMTARDWRKTRN